MITNLILFWLLPSLVALLFLIYTERVTGGYIPKEYDAECWLIVTVTSIVYPLGFIACLTYWAPKIGYWMLGDQP